MAMCLKKSPGLRGFHNDDVPRPNLRALVRSVDGMEPQRLPSLFVWEQRPDSVLLALNGQEIPGVRLQKNGGARPQRCCCGRCSSCLRLRRDPKALPLAFLVTPPRSSGLFFHLEMPPTTNAAEAYVIAAAKRPWRAAPRVPHAPGCDQQRDAGVAAGGAIDEGGGATPCGASLRLVF